MLDHHYALILAFINSKKTAEYEQTYQNNLYFTPPQNVSEALGIWEYNSPRSSSLFMGASLVFTFSIISMPVDMTFDWSLWVPSGWSTDLICADICNTLRRLSDHECPLFEWCFKSTSCFKENKMGNECGLWNEQRGKMSWSWTEAVRVVAW